MTNPDPQAVLREQFRDALITYNMDTTAGGMDEEKAFSYFADQILTLFTQHHNELIDRAVAVMPSKREPEIEGNFYKFSPYKSAIDKGHNEAIDQAIAALEGLKQQEVGKGE